MSRADDAIAIVIESRGGQAYAFDEYDLRTQINYHTTRGRKVWVFRKAETWESSETSPCSTDLKPDTRILP